MCFKPLGPKSVKIYIYLVVHILYKGVRQLENKQDLLISLPHVMKHLFFFCCFGIPLSSSAEVTQRPRVFWDTLPGTCKGILKDCPFHIFWQTATRCLEVRFAWSDNVISCSFEGCSYSGGSDYPAGCHLIIRSSDHTLCIHMHVIKAKHSRAAPGAFSGSESCPRTLQPHFDWNGLMKPKIDHETTALPPQPHQQIVGCSL